MAFTVLSEGRFRGEDVSFSVDDAVASYIGVLGAGAAGARMLADSWDNEKQSGLIRVNNRYVDEVKSALTLIRTINGKETIFRSVGLSGILRKAKMYADGSKAAKRVM
ncbi:MAG TPA: Rpp14/Pop5 family protein [Candidatus Nanoarchaeia archaeon]|nr:Rpp14/Pop5 family protein [Candidatus Nanoarchaeia archaeon]